MQYLRLICNVACNTGSEPAPQIQVSDSSSVTFGSWPACAPSAIQWLEMFSRVEQITAACGNLQSNVELS